MKRTVGALTALALLSSTAAWAASSHRTPTLNAHPDRDLPNFDLSLERAKRVGPADDTEKPRFLWNTRDQETRARAYDTLPAPLAANAQLRGLAKGLGLAEVRTMGLSYASITSNQLGQRIVNYEQRVGGIEVFRGGASVLLDRSQQAIAYSSRLVPQAFGVRNIDASAFELSASAAVAIGYADMTGEALSGDLLVPAEGQGDYLRFTSASILNAQQSFLATPARAKRVLFPTQHGLVPAWYVEVQAQRPGSRESDGFAYVVAATGRKGKLESGTLLMRHNLVADADLVIRAWADQTPPYTPHDGPEGTEVTPYPYPAFNPAAPYVPYVASNLVTLPDARTSAARDAWLVEGETQSLGNHAFAYADLAAPDFYSAGDVVGEMNLPFGFDYTFDTSLHPAANAEQIQAAIAQLFYTNNWLHDFFYPAGFDEVSGNAQFDNFGRGGVDGDQVHAQAQDHSGFDNANMATPADGASPRMQMYLFQQVGPWTVEVIDPVGFGPVTANVSSVGPQVYDLTSDVVIATPNADCGLDDDPADLAGKAVVVPWDFNGCNPVYFLMANDEAGAAVSLVNWGDPMMPDYAPYIGGDEDLSTIPVLFLSLNSTNDIEAALQNGPVVIHTVRTPSTYLDGTIDNAIVAHEWGHYLTNRLVGNGSGLGTNQARSMGEGWSDFVSLLMTTRPEDAANPNNADWSGAFAMSTYATRGFNEEWASYFGIRRLPYSTDRSKNPLTFRHIDDSQTLPFDQAPMLDLGPNSSFHNSGEVWATTLWEGYVSLLRAHDFAEAQTRMKNYLVAGLKLTPVQPTFTEARDALLAAIYAHDTADYERFAAAFASRGMGVLAVSPARTSTDHAGVVESFISGGLPSVVEATLTDDSTGRYCDRDGVLDNEEDGTLTLRIANLGWSALPEGSITVTSSTPGVSIASGAVVPAIGLYGEATVSIPVSLDGVTASPATLSFEVQFAAPGVETLPSSSVTLLANYDEVTSTIEQVNAPAEYLPWSHERDVNLAANQFQVIQSGVESLFYGYNTDATSDYSLVSPVLQVGQDPLSISFRHFHEFEYWAAGPEYYDGAVIELSADGGPWTDIGNAIVSGPGYGGVIEDLYGNPLGGREAFVGRHAGYPAFQITTLDLGTTYAGQDVRIRFRIGTDVAYDAEGWYVDDISVTGITNAPFIDFVANSGVCENRPPEANAGDDFTVNEREVGSLNGSAVDPDGTTGLIYAWTQVDGPAVTLDTPDAATTSFTAPEVTANATATFKLTVSDGEFTGEDTVVVTIVNVNRAPVADAGAAVILNEREPGELLGSGTDPDGDALTYAWTQVDGPVTVLTTPDAATTGFMAPEVTADTAATFKLTVSDGELFSEDTVVVTIVNVNRAPVADAGADISVNELEAGQLQGTGTDPDGDAVTYAWSQVDGPTVTLDTPSAATTTFTAPEVAADATATFKLTVSDGTLSGEDTVVVTITNVNRAPIADAGEAQTVRTGAAVSLTGAGVDPDGDVLTFAWSQVSGETVTLDGATTSTPSFTAPEVTEATELVFALVVSDGALSSAPSQVTVTVVPNEAPVLALIGDSNLTGDEGTQLTVAVEATDADGDEVSVAWSQVSGPAAILEGADTAEVTVTLPSIEQASAEIVLQAVPNDGFVDGEPVTVTIVVTDTDGGEQDGAPVVTVANAGPTGAGSNARLEAQGSDPQGGTLSYVWEQVAGPEAELTPDGKVLWVRTPDVKEAVVLEFKVTATSSVSGLSASATATVPVVVYQGGGCGGCTSAGAGTLVPAGLAFLAFALRRRRLKV